MSEIIDLTGGKTSGGAQGSPEMFKEIVDGANSRKTFNVSKYKNYQCECGCQLFTTAVVIKQVPAIDLGEILNEDVPLPVEQVPVWVCTKCGELAPFIKQDEGSMKVISKLLMKDTEPEKEQKKD